jgi:ABC-2 type transport system permease protein
MRILPILLQTRLLTIKNRWLHSGHQGMRELAAIAISLLMISAIYISTRAALRDVSKTVDGVSLDLTGPLGVMLATLFVMIFLSAAVSSLGALFISSDVELTRSSPLSSSEFLRGKACDIGVSVAWMVCSFGLPSLIAFGNHQNGGALFMAMAPVVCVAYLSLAVLSGMIAALLFAAVLPSAKSKQLLIALFVASLGVFVSLVNSASSLTTANSSPSLTDSLLGVGFNPWLPSTHCALAITALLKGDLREPSLYLLECAGCLAVVWLGLRAAFAIFYERGLANTRHHRGLVKIHSRFSQSAARILLPLCSTPSRAIISKEYKIFSRDLTHTVQLSLLLGVTFVYLYNYGALHEPANASEDILALWNIFLILSNVCLGALVITSICSRFVFPSVSMEGHSFWLIQSAPVALKEILKAKFTSWLLPVSCIGAVIFISGAMALNAEVPLVLASCAAGVILCHGLVGLGVGLGALFAQFEWEHSTQLATGLGSFLFMLASMFFVALSMIPLGLMFGVYILFPERHAAPYFSHLVLGSGLLTTYLVSRATSGWALYAGARALQPR